MSEPSGLELFTDRRAKCVAPITDVIDFLMKVAANAGPDIQPPIYEAGGNGPKYANPGGQFCKLHLRTTTAHVWVWVYGADREKVIADRFEPSEQDDWFKVGTMPDAVRFVKWIVAAHAKRA